MTVNDPPPMPAPLRLTQGPESPNHQGQIPLDPQVPTAWGRPRRDWREWHGWAYIALPLLLFCLFVGIARLGLDAVHNVKGTASPSPTISLSNDPSHAPSSPKPSPGPTYDLAGYQAALTGSKAQAYATALGKLRADYRFNDFATASTDAGNLIYAGNVWLTQLKATDPPPAVRGAKATYMLAIRQGVDAGQSTQSWVTASNLAQSQNGARLTVRALAALKRAAASSPTGS